MRSQLFLLHLTCFISVCIFDISQSDTEWVHSHTTLHTCGKKYDKIWTKKIKKAQTLFTLFSIYILFFSIYDLAFYF